MAINETIKISASCLVFLVIKVFKKVQKCFSFGPVFHKTTKVNSIHSHLPVQCCVKFTTAPRQWNLITCSNTSLTLISPAIVPSRLSFLVFRLQYKSIKKHFHLILPNVHEERLLLFVEYKSSFWLISILNERAFHVGVPNVEGAKESNVEKVFFSLFLSLSLSLSLSYFFFVRCITKAR